MGIPAKDRDPMVFDGSTSVVAEGKVRLARAKGAELPPGCIVDANGGPSQTPDDFYAGGALLPLGGEVAGHKGYGLALASALIGGLGMVGDPTPTLAGASVSQATSDAIGRIAGVFVAIVDPAAFGETELYSTMVADTLAAAKRVAPAAGRTEVLIPGEIEARTRVQRERDGIVLPEATWNDLAKAADRFSMKMPPAVEIEV
jgi:LDH2 family malate/lactate/ureidoglycolate dehydrogenase